VHDRRRQWCPRCQGALLAPSNDVAPSVWSGPGHRHQLKRSAPRLPSGYRWIAVRPGAAPSPRRRRRPLGPTPRYAVMPRWGLIDPALTSAAAKEPAGPVGPSPWVLRATLTTMCTVLAAAIVLHALRYLLLIINRTTLLQPLLAGLVTWLCVLASVGAVIAVIGTAVVLTRWLIARRAAAFARRGWPDPRSVWALRAGCLIPFVNLLWAPVFVIELSDAEDQHARLHRPIMVWWGVWLASTAVSVFASATAFTQDAQGIANNTVSFIVAYLFALATVVATAQVVFAFERKPVERPAHRWVMVPVEPAGGPDESAAESAAPVESERQEPAA
jgi:Domain of unknown function (DUF4328)